jgi:hypothetical protein
MDEPTANLDTLNPPLSDLRLPAAKVVAGDVACKDDVPTDAPFVDPFGVGTAATSVPIEVEDRDACYARVDPEPRLIVGFQIEDFLSNAAAPEPPLRDVLAFARAAGASAGEEARLRDETNSRIVERSSTAGVVADPERLIAWGRGTGSGAGTGGGS